MDKLKTTRPFVWEALELKKKLARWQAQTASLNILQLVRSGGPFFWKCVGSRAERLTTKFT